jgi:hypothetical protein
MRQALKLGVLLLAFAPAALTGDDQIERLKTIVAAQQEQIDELRRLLKAQQKLIEKSLLRTEPAPVQNHTQTPSDATVVSPAAVAAPALPDSAPVRGPLSLNIGALQIAPTGFFDFAQVWRTRTVSSGLATNFAAIPFYNTVFGQRNQTLSAGANSRFGLQADTKVLGVHILGVAEADFLGYQPGNLTTTSNSYGLRLRLAFADLRKDKWEVLGGQAWSLLTPARTGISPLPETLFLTQDLDPNIQSGLVWARVPQLRIAYHPSEKITIAVSSESGSTYVGGSAGAGAIVLPSAFGSNYFGQVDNGNGGSGVPNANSDLVAKIAFDPDPAGRAMHFEMAGLATRFVFFNPANQRHFGIIGGGVAFNAGIEVAPSLTLFTNNFFTKGGGSYIFGEAPDLIIRGNGAPSLVPAASTVDGFEYQVTRKWKLWAYYGGTSVSRRTTIDPSTGQPVGYGYFNSPNNQNRSIQQISAGFDRDFWRNPNYGSLRFMGQYSWLVRHPWYTAPGQPASANLNMVYLGLRYMLPGAPVPK